MAYREALLKGTLVNVLGLLAKLLYPLLIFVLTRLFGAELMGHYFLGLAMIELGTGAVTAGWATAATLWVSPHAEESRDNPEASAQMNETLGRTLTYSLGTALLLALLVQFFGSFVVHRFFEEHLALLPGIYFLGWAMVPTAFANIIGAASKAHLTMTWDAALGGARPVLLLSASVLVYLLGGGLTGLFASYFFSMLGLAFFSLVPFVRYFDWRQVLRNVRPVWDGKLVDFAVPQALNHTLSMYITRLDTIMLGALGVKPADLAWYATASYLTSNLQQVRIVFSTMLAPIVARHHFRREKLELSELLTTTTRWISSIFPALAILVIVLRRDILGLVDPSYARGGDLFFLVLLIPATVSCTVGLSGNFIVYTGHSKMNLLNAVLVGVLNTALNWLWIPRYGLLGAASATATSMLVVGCLQVVELWMLERVRVRFRQAFMPYAGAGVAAAILGAIWDPADIGGPPARIAIALGTVAAYALTLFVTGQPEVRSFVRRGIGSRHAPSHIGTGVDYEKSGKSDGDR